MIEQINLCWKEALYPVTFSQDSFKVGTNLGSLWQLEPYQATFWMFPRKEIPQPCQATSSKCLTAPIVKENLPAI